MDNPKIEAHKIITKKCKIWDKVFLFFSEISFEKLVLPIKMFIFGCAISFEVNAALVDITDRTKEIMLIMNSAIEINVDKFTFIAKIEICSGM